MPARSNIRMAFSAPARVCLALAASVAFSGAARAHASSPVRVGVVPAEMKEVTKGAAFVGRVDAVEKVDIRARVKGYLRAVKFKEGQAVKVGEPLFEIEPDLFKADVEQAQGALERAEAAKTLAAIQLQRASELLAKQAGTAVQRDQAAASDQQAAGGVLSARANLDTAKINLGYTSITSPINGRIGMTNVTAGNVVGPDSGVLATIVSEDPIYVTFPVSQREFMRVTGDARSKLDNVGASLIFADGATYGQTGKVDFVDVKVDRATDTITLRAVFPNPDGVLRDGQLVRVQLASDKPQSAMVVPQSALLADKDGVYVFVVEDGKAAIRRVKTGAEAGNDVVVADGLSQGDLVIVEGLTNVRPGARVTASPIQSGS
ncbi:efflux RND transporter periplasmic adaptor subunit [Rhodoblastus sp.]|uniref:efflux RND transporter periplasmic adaptor subunit n=1 Tax=Rhodoblastus sp. TaxID=1962975 RepID=UPI00262761CC|nr:efflux RND transporter periplasmic adaptor subunit [Rhodoblastus sp.]